LGVLLGIVTFTSSFTKKTLQEYAWYVYPLPIMGDF
jgi:hypothetical protein